MKSLFEQMGGIYRPEGDCFIPNVTLPDEDNQRISVWGQRHKRYLKQNHRVLYVNLLTSGRLNAHLAEIDKQTQGCFE